VLSRVPLPLDEPTHFSRHRSQERPLLPQERLRLDAASVDHLDDAARDPLDHDVRRQPVGALAQPGGCVVGAVHDDPSSRRRRVLHRGGERGRHAREGLVERGLAISCDTRDFVETGELLDAFGERPARALLVERHHEYLGEPLVQPRRVAVERRAGIADEHERGRRILAHGKRDPCHRRGVADDESAQVAREASGRGRGERLETRAAREDAPEPGRHRPVGVERAPPVAVGSHRRRGRDRLVASPHGRGPRIERSHDLVAVLPDTQHHARRLGIVEQQSQRAVDEALARASLLGRGKNPASEVAVAGRVAVSAGPGFRQFIDHRFLRAQSSGMGSRLRGATFNDASAIIFR